jgi:uncharacterized membrane protein YkvA (DUF1232 family)
MTLPPDIDETSVSTTPTRANGLAALPAWLLIVGAVIGIIYLINPTAGLIEIIPDNLPFLGNLDEAGAAVLVITGIQELIKRRKSLKS